MFSKTLALAALAALAAAAPVRRATDSRIDGPGILLKNAGTLNTEYCFFNNLWNGDATAGPNFDNPQDCTHIAPGGSTWVPLPPSFKGRVQRTTNFQATWVEFQLAASNDNFAHGDVSIEQGSDGPATISSTDGSNQQGGFTKELVPIAPAGTTTVRASDGQTVLQTTMGNWLSPANQQTADWARTQIDGTKTYIQGGVGVDDVSSTNQAMLVTFY